MTALLAGGELRVGVVGVGYLGRHHARIYASQSGVRLVGVADSSAERAREIGALHGAEAFTDHRRLLGRVDAVSVATPTVSHRAVAADFLREGVAVLVEKPMAATLPEADDLISLAAGTGALLAVGHTERFNPAVEALCERAREPRFIEVHRLGTFPARSLDIDVVLDLMIHDIDLVLALSRGAGSEGVEALDAVGVNALTRRVDIANARLRMRGGCVANLTASRISTGKVRKVRVFTRDAYLSCDCADQTLEEYRLAGAPGSGAPPAIARTAPAITRDEPLARELRAFAEAARSRSPFAVTGAQGREALAVALAVAERIEEGLREGAR
ncbi:MAG: Gfo/Idh/MocA family oxidoreductase [Acidobacteria bacterium]|nr:Gfo/Idh/MocA family oxidoreductase [Acidobacteriota bacterium]